MNNKSAIINLFLSVIYIILFSLFYFVNTGHSLILGAVIAILLIAFGIFGLFYNIVTYNKQKRQIKSEKK